MGGKVSKLFFWRKKNKSEPVIGEIFNKENESTWSDCTAEKIANNIGQLTNHSEGQLLHILAKLREQLKCYNICIKIAKLFANLPENSSYGDGMYNKEYFTTPKNIYGVIQAYYMTTCPYKINCS